MQCDGITSEDYALWPLGLAEDAAADLIRLHLSQGCANCVPAIRESVAFWAVYGAAASFEPDAAPSPAVRARLLEAIEKEGKAAPMGGRAPIPITTGRPRFVFAAVGAAAAVLVAGFLGWQAGRRQGSPAPPAIASPVAQANVSLEQLNRRIADLQAKLNASENEVEQLRSQAAPAASVKQVTLQRERNGGPGEVDKALAEANSQIQQLKIALEGEQAKAGRLAQEFDQQKASLATLARGRRDAEAELAERDRRIQTLDGAVARLEHERDMLNVAFNTQKGRVEHALQLVSLLSAPSTRLVRLATTEAAPGASAYAILAEGNRLIFTAGRLPALPAGKVYQLWLMRGKNPGIVSGGIFRGGAAQATIEFTDPALLTDVKALAVTEEPAGGSRLPTGHKLLIGAAKS